MKIYGSASSAIYAPSGPTASSPTVLSLKGELSNSQRWGAGYCQWTFPFHCNIVIRDESKLRVVERMYQEAFPGPP
jgi:hypothetical protein